MLHGIVQQVDGTKSGNIKQLGPFLFGNPGIICRVSFIPEASTDIGSKQDAFRIGKNTKFSSSANSGINESSSSAHSNASTQKRRKPA